MKSNPTNHFQSAKRLLTVIFAGCALSIQAGATSFTWDADGAAPANDGTGNWNATGGTNWANGASYGAWGNTTVDTAIFGVASGAADTINVGTVNANTLTFSAPGSGSYTLTGGTITLGGTSPTINANTGVRIDSTISSTTANAFIRGAATLTLGGTATFTGGQAWEGLYRYVPASTTGGIAVVAGANISAKNFALQQDNATNCTINYNQTGGTVAVSAGFGLGGSTTGGASGTNTATISGGTLTAAEVYLYKWATSNLNVTSAGVMNATSLRIGWVDSSPSGTINLGDGTTFSGGTSILDGGTSGLLKVNSWNIQNVRNYTLNFKGGTLKAGAAGTNWLPANAFSTTAGANVQEAGGIIDNGGYAITIAQALKHGGVAATDGGLIFNGSGTTTLSGAVSYTGPSKVAAGTLAGSTTLGDVSVANNCTLAGGNAGVGTLTAANVTLGSVATDITALKGKLSATPGYKPLAVTNLTLNGGNGTVTLDVSGTGLTNGNTYDLLVSANPISAPNATTVLAALKSNARAFSPVVAVDLKKIQVYYDANASVYWTGANGTAWNLADTNWKLAGNNSNTQFLANDVVYFHDNPTSNTVDISGANVSPSVVTFDNTFANTAYTLQGTHGIAAGTITKINDGTLTITNTNPTTGAVALNGGTVSISQTGGLGTGSLTFDGGTLDYTGATTTWTRNFTTNTNGGTLGVTNGTDLTLSGTLGGTGALTKTGTGTLYVSTLNAGATLILDQGTNYCNTGGGIKGNLKINTGATFSNTQAHVFDRPGSRVWINGGTLGHGPAGYPEYYLPLGTSSSDPGLRMTGGILAGGGQNRFDPGNAYITTDGASTTALISGDTTIYQGGAQIYTVAAGTVTEGTYPGVDLEVTGSLAFNFGGGTTNVTKAGAGVMEVRGPAALNGTVTLTEGVLRLTGSNAVTNFGGTSVALDAANAATLQLNAVAGGDNLTFSKGITGGSASAAVTKLGDGNVTFTTAKTYLGATHLDAGTLTLQANLNTASGPITVADGTTLKANTNDVSVGSIAVSSGGTLVTGTPAKSLTCTTLTFDGTATVMPSLAEGATPITVTDLTVNGGAASITLQPTSSGLVSGTTYNVLTVTGTTNITDASAFVSSLRAFTPSYDTGTKTIKLTYDANTALLWTGVESGDWNLTATNNWKLTGDTPTAFMISDVVEFPTSPAGSTTVGIWDADVLPASTTFSNTTATTYTVEGIYGIASGQLTKTNDGTVILTTANTYTGATTINGGTLQLGDEIANGTLAPAGTITNNANLTFHNSNGGLVQGVGFSSGGIIGTGSLTKSGTSQLTLNVANGYSGGTTVSQGTLQLNQVNAAGTGGAITLGDANTADNNVILVANVGSGSFTNPITVSAANTGTGTVTIAQPQNLSTLTGLLTLNRATTVSGPGDRSAISGKITGTVGTFTFAGGRITMEQSQANASDFTGNVVVTGRVQLNTAYGLPSTASVTVANGGRFGFVNASGPDPIIGQPTIRIDGLNGAGGVDGWTGGGNMAQTLAVGSNGGSGSFSGVISNAAGAANGDIVSLLKTGAGTQILSGPNSYTGTTTINGGTLQIDGANTGGGAVTVKSAATLAGIGSVSGNTTVEAGGFVAPGQNGIGSLTLASGTLAGTYQCQLDATAGDQVIVTGVLTVSPGAAITISGPTGAPSYTIATYTSVSGALPTITPPTGYTVETASLGTMIKLVKTAGYDQWASQITNGLNLRTDDADGDGFTNLQEFLFGTSPIAGNGSLTTAGTTGGNLVIRWLQRETGGIYTLKQNATLTGAWTPVTSPVPAADLDQTGVPTDYDRFKVTLPLGAGKDFFRIEGVEN